MTFTQLRIVSLIPSGTEIIVSLGLGDSLVGRSHECDFPPEVQNLPVCCRSRIDTTASSLEIDRQVHSALQQALSIYKVDTETINQLAPTHVITQSQCEACAVSLRDVQAALSLNVESAPEIISLSPMGLSDLWHDILRLATTLGVPKRGEQLVQSLHERLRLLKNRCFRTASRPRVLCIEWLEPLMSAGNWVPELVDIAGGTPLLASNGTHSPYVSWEALSDADPDLIVLMPCGLNIERTRAELPVLTQHAYWERLRAVQDGQVYLTDGNQFFNRPGPRLIESAEILAEILWGNSDSSTLPHHQAGNWIRI